MHFGLVHALDGATFTVARGEVVGLLGSNGAGKTTTMRILTTYLVPSAGGATVAGFDVVKDPLEVRKRIGWAVEKCGLSEMFHTPVLQLSKGFRQRTALAQALLHDPEDVILDEPTTGLDPHQILEIRALVRDLAKTKCVVLSTHILQEANALADRLLVMSRGRIVGMGTANELLRQAGVRPKLRLRLAAPVEGALAAVAAVPGAREVVAHDGAVFDLQEDEPGV